MTACAHAQTITVTGSVEVTPAHPPNRQPPSNASVVVWLTPAPTAGADPVRAPVTAPQRRRFTLVQKNKTFEPHLLVIPAGSEVEFPNKDAFFHNVFSLFDGKRFDLGLYESGTSRAIRFDRPGVSFLFCNIHSEMSAVVVTLDSPYYSVSDGRGQLSIPGVPPGRYTLHVWREGSSPSELKNLSRSMVFSEEANSFGRLALTDSNSPPQPHKNKYNQDYDNPTPPGQVYRK